MTEIIPLIYSALKVFVNFSRNLLPSLPWNFRQLF